MCHPPAATTAHPRQTPPPPPPPRAQPKVANSGIRSPSRDSMELRSGQAPPTRGESEKRGSTKDRIVERRKKDDAERAARGSKEGAKVESAQGESAKPPPLTLSSLDSVLTPPGRRPGMGGGGCVMSMDSVTLTASPSLVSWLREHGRSPLCC